MGKAMARGVIAESGKQLQIMSWSVGEFESLRVFYNSFKFRKIKNLRNEF